MKCEKCNEYRRKKDNEARKKVIVKSYTKDWKKWMMVLILSVIQYGLFAILSRSIQFEIPMILRWSIALALLFLFFFTMLIALRMRLGLLSLSSLMLWTGPVTQFTQFKTPIVDLMFLFLILSFAGLLIDIGLGVIFKIKVTLVERPWCANREQPRRFIKKGSRKK